MSNLPHRAHPTHVLGIIGGAVAGSEAARLAAERGALAIVFEMGERPYGKIEDGLPKWHEKLRNREYAKIDANLDHPNVLYVPLTQLGRDVSFETLTEELGLSAVVLANGAWRDRPLPIEGVDAHIDAGLVYQNAFVHWFNHYHEPGYEGRTFDIPEGTLVVGGGLASIDVVKIINLELYAAALRRRGHEVDIVEMEIKGIPATLEKLGLSVDTLAIKGASLYYRRAKADMPLATAENPTPAQLEKLRAARVKIMERVERKYLVRFEGNQMPVAALSDGPRLTGIRFRRTVIEDGRVRGVDGSETDVLAPLVISSIGSVPEAIEGVPMKGELYDYADWEHGILHGHSKVFGLGNVLTGKGNIRESRHNAIEVAGYILGEQLGMAEPQGPSPSDRVRSQAEPIVKKALNGPPLAPEKIDAIQAWVERRWEEIGYGGDYAAWAARHAPPPVR